MQRTLICERIAHDLEQSLLFKTFILLYIINSRKGSNGKKKTIQLINVIAEIENTLISDLN